MSDFGQGFLRAATPVIETVGGKRLPRRIVISPARLPSSARRRSLGPGQVVPQRHFCTENRVPTKRRRFRDSGRSATQDFFEGVALATSQLEGRRICPKFRGNLIRGSHRRVSKSSLNEALDILAATGTDRHQARQQIIRIATEFNWRTAIDRSAPRVFAIMKELRAVEQAVKSLRGQLNTLSPYARLAQREAYVCVGGEMVTFDNLFGFPSRRDHLEEMERLAAAACKWAALEFGNGDPQHPDKGGSQVNSFRKGFANPKWVLVSHCCAILHRCRPGKATGDGSGILVKLVEHVFLYATGCGDIGGLSEVVKRYVANLPRTAHALRFSRTSARSHLGRLCVCRTRGLGRVARFRRGGSQAGSATPRRKSSGDTACRDKAPRTQADAHEVINERVTR